MRAQVNFTPTESKKLITKAVAKMPLVQRAARNGRIVIHPSSSTYFLAQELTGEDPKFDSWVCGSITPKGLCVEMGILSSVSARDENNQLDPGGFPFQVVVKGGKASTGQTLNALLSEMGPEDVYIKGVNAVDIERNVGILIGHHTGGGTIGRVLAAQKQRSFNVVYIAGLEKLVPSVDNAMKALRGSHIEYAMGMAVRMVPVKGAMVISEPEAFNILSSCSAVPVAGGGIGGAEGSITLILEGKDDMIKNAVNVAELCKGAKLPQFRGRSCTSCPNVDCQFPVGRKPWVV